jgi:hypothetical protein
MSARKKIRRSSCEEPLRTFATGIVAIAILVNFSSSVLAGSCLSCPSVYKRCAINCGRPLRPGNWQCLVTCKDALRFCHVRCTCPNGTNKSCWGVDRSYDCKCT